MSRKQINLYQAEFRPAPVVLPAQSLLLGVAAFTLGLLALSAWDGWRLARLRAETDQVVARAEAVARQVEQAGVSVARTDPAIIAEAETLEARTRALQAAQAAVASGALGGETGFSAQFRALARTTVPGAWLTGVEIADRGREMNLHGRAVDGESPARLIASLRREPLFVGLSFAALDVHPPQAAAGEPVPAQDKDKAAAPAPFLEFSLTARLPEADAQGPGHPAAATGRTP